jgi:2,3-bisphosphoglycerate-dependent phosphoglycerate mutase
MSPIADRRVVLVRHGESQVTVDRVIGGHRSCSGLSDLGRTQANRLRDRLMASGDLRHAVLVSTHYPRARETAEIISPAFANPLIIEVPELGEHDPGPLCDGMKYDDFTAQFGAGPDWDDMHGEVFPGGGETKAAFNMRVGQAMSKLLIAEPARDLVIACHAGVIGSVFRELLALAPVGGFSLDVRNTSLTEFSNSPGQRWRLVRHNDAAHLDGLPVATE